MARAAIRTGFHAYANEFVVPRMFSGVFKVTTLLPALAQLGSVDGNLGRKTSGAMIGKSLPPGKKATLRGSTQAQIFYQLAKVGGGKYIGVDDTASSAGSSRSSRQKSSAYVSWFEHEQPIAVENQQLDAAGGGFAVGSIVDDSTQMALEEQIEQISTDIYTGDPTESAEIWDAPLGLQQWIHGANTAAGVDRTASANQYFRGERSTGAHTLSLSFIDAVCLEGVSGADDSGTTTPLFNNSSLANLIVVPNAGYNKLKQEALSRNVGTRQTTSMPSGGSVGYLGEWIDYNGKMIVPDPYCPASSIFILDSSTWLFQTFSGKNFTVQKFQNLRELQPGTGQPDLTTSASVVKARLLCFEPWKNFQGTNVT